MSEGEPIASWSGRQRSLGTDRHRHPAAICKSNPIAFNRRELNEILGLYGRKVANGEWRDYAIDALSEKAVFSVFRHSAEFPLYRIEKHGRRARRHGIYRIIATGGLILKRGHTLAQVLGVLDRRLRIV